MNGVKTQIGPNWAIWGSVKLATTKGKLNCNATIQPQLSLWAFFC